MANSAEPDSSTTWNDFFHSFEKMSLDIFNSDTSISDIVKNIMQPEDAYAINDDLQNGTASIPEGFEKCICQKLMYLTREVEGEDEYINTFVSNIDLDPPYDSDTSLQCEVNMFKSKDDQSIMIYFEKNFSMNHNDWDEFLVRTKDDLNTAVLKRNPNVRNAFVSEDVNQYRNYPHGQYVKHDIQYTIAVTKKRVIVKKYVNSDFDGTYAIKIFINRYDCKGANFPDNVYDFFKKELSDPKNLSSLQGRPSMYEITFTPYKINTEKLTEMFGTFLQGTHERLGKESPVSLLDELVLNKVQILLKSSLAVMKLDIKMSLTEVLNALGDAVINVLYHDDQDIAGKMPRVLDTRVFI
jgi:hypothetical protein